MKKLQKVPNFFSRNEKFFVGWLGTFLLFILLMLLSTRIYKLELPVVFGKILIESLGLLSVVIPTCTFLWGVSSNRRESEKTAQIKKITELSTILKDYHTKILEQQQTDKRLEQTINQQQNRIDNLQLQIGRIAVQVAQFESGTQTRKRLEKIEQLLLSEK